jgi:hypothetical protein
MGADGRPPPNVIPNKDTKMALQLGGTPNLPLDLQNQGRAPWRTMIQITNCCERMHTNTRWNHSHQWQQMGHFA